MAKCAVCGKGVHFGIKVSHSHRRSNKMWKPNIKSVRVKVNGGTKKMPVCTGCLRSGAVERASVHLGYKWGSDKPVPFLFDYLNYGKNFKMDKLMFI